MKEIRYTGMSTRPDDYTSPDGDLRFSFNLTQDGGTLRPVMPPKVIASLPTGATAVYLHKTSSGTNYVYNLNGSATWTPQGGSGVNSLGDITGVASFSSVGNTLIAVGETGIYYLLWADGAYTLLGDRLPEVSLNFGLKGYPRSYRFVENDGATTDVKRFDSITTFTAEERTKFSPGILAILNSFTENEGPKKGRFVYPFFVRYALRLYDGSLVCHSAPVLMTPLTHGPMVIATDIDKNDNGYAFYTDTILVAATLDYIALVEDEIQELERWKDIVKSVDVFVSAPIYTYDQSGEVTGAVYACTTSMLSAWPTTEILDRNDVFAYNKFVGELQRSGSSSSDVANDHTVGDVTLMEDCYATYTFSEIYKMYFKANRKLPAAYILLPTKTFTASGATASNVIGTTVSTDTDNTYNTISSTSLFYKLVSLQLSDLRTDRRVDIEIADDYLQSLTSREAMTDDYLTHDKLSATMAYNYNQRLLLSGIKRTLYKGYHPYAIRPYVNKYLTLTEDGTKMTFSEATNRTWLLRNRPYSVCVYIRDNGGEYVVESDMSDGSQVTLTGKVPFSWGCYLFYPNSNAYKMRIRVYGGLSDDGESHNYYDYDVALTPHDYLNGAYALLPYNTSRPGAVEATAPTVSDLVPVSNKVYESQVNDPFYFPASGIITVGTGKVLAIAAAVKPLSEGQFGQYPVYAFCDEGVWALETTATGTFSARSPVTRDVLLSAESLCQLDQSVIFATARGIMELAGNTTRCLSESFGAKSEEELICVDDLPLYSGAFPDTVFVDSVPFLSYIKECRMVYNYIDQNIVVFNPKYHHAYLYDIATHTWGLIRSTLESTLNAYPEAYAIDRESHVVDLAQSDETSVAFELVTRPLKLDLPDVLKTVRVCIQRGRFPAAAMGVLLYASRDLINWYFIEGVNGAAIRNISGTPYKYFIVCVVGTLTAADRLSGCTIDEIPRFTHRPH